MAQAARRGHPRCKACTLPTTVRAEIAKRRRAGESIRAISEYVVNEGHSLGKDGVALHLKQCVGLMDNGDGSDPETRSVLMARTVGRLFEPQPGKLATLAEQLNDSGMAVEAEIVQAHVPSSLRRALELTDGTPGHDLIAARALAIACARVLGTSHPEAARDIAAELEAQGAQELAADLIWLAERATQNRRSEEKVSPGSGSAPPAVAQLEESG